MRVQEVKENLTELLGEELLAGVPLLVFANKQDLEMALEAPEVSRLALYTHPMTLTSYACYRLWSI